MSVENRFLFNFAASYSSGGYKRLYEYANWFNDNGGAWFVIHPRCAGLVAEFPINRFFVVSQSRIRRLYDDCAYLDAIRRDVGSPELYYSYGIPLYFRFGQVNWFHLSNVLPIESREIPLSVPDRLTFYYLGWRIKKGFKIADVISAESNSSLALVDRKLPEKLFLSVNGSDDELRYLQENPVENKEDIVAVVGTHRYKALEDSMRLFRILKDQNHLLKLVILGNEKWVPKSMKGMEDVVVRGMIKRPEVINYLRKAKFYISTTRVENSYNAASEGVVFADESYISDIGPHRELLANVPFERMHVSGIGRPLLHVRRENLTGLNLKSWNTVVLEMVARFREASRRM
jgi:hypothetical protein